MATLEIKDLHVDVRAGSDTESKEILRGVDLTVKSGETHAIMGPNGSGKSTLAYAIAGHPKYVVTSGEILLDGKDVLSLSVDERARAGLFLAMQYPVEVPASRRRTSCAARPPPYAERPRSCGTGSKRSSRRCRSWRWIPPSPSAA
jgi:Fe-S cluster assembly ATPase SufC